MGETTHLIVKYKYINLSQSMNPLPLPPKFNLGSQQSLGSSDRYGGQESRIYYFSYEPFF